MSQDEHLMLIGYVSDENYLALLDVVLEFERDGEPQAVITSSPRGAVYGDLPAGQYRVTLAKPGFCSKTVTVSITPDDVPVQFRLLSDSLYGYAWPKWVEGGQTGEFRVHSPEPYRLSLWRYGKTKELVQRLGVFDEHGPRANCQILPDGDFTQSGVDWNHNGFDPSNYCVVAPKRGGLYYFHVETTTGRFLSFPWVVAPAKPQAAVAIIASTNTWNAYNNFGGRSNYINANQLPDRPTVNARQDLDRYRGEQVGGVWRFRDDEYMPLSFDRPEPFNHIDRDVQLNDPIRSRQGCHLAEAEWKLLGWLEREGFEYDVYSDHQLHAGRLDLSAYKVVILSTHPEYWSRRQYQRIKQWVFKEGGKLMYLGGNGIDCEIEYPDETSMIFKTWLPTPPGKPLIDPDTGKVYDCRFHHRVESPAELLGEVFKDGGYLGAPYEVIDDSHWIFSGTKLKNGDLFGIQSLHARCPGGASGHETDCRTPHSPRNAKLLAKGTNPNESGGEILYYETPSGGAAFSVGSIIWPSSALVDEGCSKITRNVLEHMLG